MFRLLKDQSGTDADCLRTKAGRARVVSDSSSLTGSAVIESFAGADGAGVLAHLETNSEG